MFSNLTYFPIDITDSFVSESVSDPAHALPGNPQEWQEEEVRIIRLALQKLSSIRIINTNDAEDLVQDTLLTMVAKRPNISLQKGSLIWSMGIFRNKVGNYYRKTQRSITVESLEEIAQQSLPEEYRSPPPERTVVLDEILTIARNSLARLPDPQRQVMELLLSGMDASEIVRRLSPPERYQSIITRIHRGRKKLAHELARYGYGPAVNNGLHAMKRCRRMSEK